MNTSQITMAETQVTAINLSSPRANRRNVGGAGAVRADGGACREAGSRPKGMAIAHNTRGVGWRQQAMEKSKVICSHCQATRAAAF
jgi:hypothetical protein